MLKDLADLPIISPSFVTAVAVLPVVVLVLLAVIARRARLVRGARAASPARAAGVLALAALLGTLAGIALAWLLGDVLDLFDVVLSTPTRGWTALGGMGLGIALVVLVGSRRAVTGVGGRAAPPRHLRALHAALTVLVVPLVVLAAGIGINDDIQEFPNAAALFGVSRISPLDVTALPARVPADDAGAGEASTPLDETWTAGEDVPRRGRVGSVTIPGTQSGFAARDALVYLPPAALVADAPRLPVVVAMSGQPGTPLDIFGAGRVDTLMDDYAAEHQGLAPIVVVPDQLGAEGANPMCVDSALGNSETYLTVDVPAWIRAHLRVLPDRTDWAVLGFSQGGTCALQLGAAHPDLFGTLVDISGEVAPTRGADTVEAGFGGSQEAYEAAFPAAVMAARAPYADMSAFFCSGEDDEEYRPQVERMLAAATAAGMDTRMGIAPGRAHDWGAVTSCVQDALPALGQRMGLAR
ncbi:S-formylglutathione hydrolase FrmB [Clavibacter sp. B3I6]|uniref:alpha/beta hydrolase n=1 Tax=Clavibacter sp. B3I6 TaxID=3042268 RepID=UPI0027862A7D|nr:alpha/beta hydrolase-fold protein [Clavibacter sp. B3I6]MDQ0743174.1 S-formylglutathione hydrolase FrmB [Clavibacter sp. B3I6]